MATLPEISSGGVIGAFVIENGAQLGQMALGLTGIVFQFLRGLFSKLMRQNPQLLPGLQRADIGLRRRVQNSKAG